MMKMLRLVRAAAVGATVALVGSTNASAQEYPSRPIRMVVPGTPGGATDVLGRVVADGMSKVLGQPIIMDDKPGASGMIAADGVLKAPADGYTLFMVYAAILTANQWLHPNLSYNAARDFVPVALTARIPMVLVVAPSVPAKSVEELVAFVKPQPGKLNYAAPTIGSMSHLAMELFKQMAGIDIVTVPFPGEVQSMTALLGNHVQLMFISSVGLPPLIQAGKVRPLAVATAKRAFIFPDLPTVAESGLPGYEFTTWFGIVVAAGTPPDIVNKLNDVIRQVLEMPETKARLAAVGAEPFSSTPAEFGAIIKRDSETLGRIVREAGIK